MQVFVCMSRCSVYIDFYFALGMDSHGTQEWEASVFFRFDGEL